MMGKVKNSALRPTKTKKVNRSSEMNPVDSQISNERPPIFKGIIWAFKKSIVETGDPDAQ